MARIQYKVRGLDCAEEVSTLRAVLEPITGVRGLQFDVVGSELTIDYVPDEVQPQELVTAITRTGMRAEAKDASQTPPAKAIVAEGRVLRIGLTAMSGFLVAAGFVISVGAAGWEALGAAHTGPWLAKALYLAAALAGAWLVLPKAWLSAKAMRPDMNLLMVFAVAGAISIGEYFEGATVSFLFSLSLTLESWSVGRARHAIAALLELAPSEARVILPDGSEQLIASDQVSIGDHFVVKPGERIPLDGQIVTGETTIDQSAITGESLPVAKAPGDGVFAGTINQDGAIEVRSTKLASDTTLARMMKLVKEAQGKRAPTEQWVERFARYYTPIVLGMALAIFVLPPLITSAGWQDWIYRGLVLLVIACPCALVISTPVSIVAALTAAARHGVLIKGGLFVEMPARLRVIAMDKTGTLTEGKPRVREVFPLSGHTAQEVLAIASAVEQRSEHPLAHAVVEYAQERGVRPPPASAFQAMKGKGAAARVNDTDVWIGSHRLLEERGQETPELHEKLEQLSRRGATTIVIGENSHVCGLVALADQLRPNAASVIQELKSAGIDRVVMVTGDNVGTAEVIGKAARVDEIHAEKLPADKVHLIENLTRRHQAVAMIGDGVNDAPAMAAASLGIAMGAIGSDAAIETADIALMTDDLSRIPWLIRHSRRTLSTIRQNIIASLSIKGAFVILTLFGHASLWAAIAADLGVSLLVILNALRLLQDAPAHDVSTNKSAHGRRPEPSI